jgi:hypothetical protein
MRGEYRLSAIAPNTLNTKGGKTMTGLADVIVCLWFLPATLYIVLPLAMLCCWLAGRIIFPQKKRRDTAVQQEAKAIMPKMLVKA